MALPTSLASRIWATKAVALALLVLMGCGAFSRPSQEPPAKPVALRHWAADSDGEIRITYRFPEPEQATDIYQAPIKTEALPEITKASVRASWKRWEAAARKRGIPLTITEVAPSDRTAKVDFIGNPLPGNITGMHSPWLRDASFGEMGRDVVTIHPNLAPWAIDVTVPHEEGHVLGLEHLSDKRSLMHPSEPNSEITEADLVALDARYPSPSPTFL